MLPILLCVDDEPSTLEALSRVLRKHFHVLTATSGDEALGLLKQNPTTAVILSDYRMPGMTGIDFLARARTLVPNAVRAILSGQIELQEMMNAINSVAIHRFILKPWDNDYLVLQMQEALQNHALIENRNQLAQLAITDPVTALSNHRFFQEQIRKEFERAIRHHRSLALVMVDVDHFKSFNDHYGHPEGDRILRSISERLTQEVRNIDLVCRYGGEEFAIIMPDTNINEAHLVSERVRSAVEMQPFVGPLGPAFVTISLGVAALPQHADEVSALIQAADRALYQAKRQGRNQTVVAT